jgi:hypothetical protein
VNSLKICFMKKLTISWNKYFVRNQIGIKKDKLTRLIANNIFFNGPQKLAIKNLYPKGKILTMQVEDRSGQITAILSSHLKDA